MNKDHPPLCDCKQYQNDNVCEHLIQGDQLGYFEKDKQYQYVLYATAEKGEGRVMEIGRCDELEEISIIVGMFDKDVIISIEEQEKL